jgi:SAM-dependent methyltransferase
MRAGYLSFRRSPYFWRATTAISKVGERWGVDWLTYHPLLFAYYHEEAVAAAPGVMQTFAHLFPNARAYVDIGAGTGAFAAHAKGLGLSAVAYEYSALGRFVAKRQGVEVRRLDLRERRVIASERPFDLAYCFEVAEHLDAALGDELIRFCAAQAPIVVFTAAPPGQGGTGHKNEQPQSYWISRFRAEGMTYKTRLSRELAEGFRREVVQSPWLANNVMVFVADPMTLGRRQSEARSGRWIPKNP